MTAVATATSVKHYSMFIDGEWVDADDRVTYEVVDPATEEVVATVPRGGRADAERAVRAAREAFDKGPWPRLTAVERAAVLRKVADKIRERAEELAALETRQMGKLLADSLVDMNDAAHTFDYYAGLASGAARPDARGAGRQLSMVVREPVGVTAGITPWNYPVLMAAWKARPVAGRRQRHDPQAGQRVAAHQPGAGADLRGGRPAEGRGPGDHRPRRRGRRLPRRATRRGHGGLHGHASRSASTSCARAPRT